MSATFTIRQGDRLPYFAYKFNFSLVNALGVTFSARDEPGGTIFVDRQPAIIANGTYVIDGEEMVLTPADGVVFYPFAVGDTAAPRKSAMCLFHVNWPGNLQESLPSQGYERMVIHDNF
jgi:hypothetical protein